MIKHGLFCFLLCLLIKNIAPSSENDANKLIKKLKDAQKWNDLGVFIIKIGEAQAINACISKKFGSMAACKIAVKRAVKEFKIPEVKSLLKKIKDSGKWEAILQYIKTNGATSVAEICYKGNYGSQTVCKIVVYYMMKENGMSGIPSSPSSGSPFTKEVKDNDEIQLIPKSGHYKYVFIFMHGLGGNPKNFVNRFDKANGPIPDSFKIILPCAPNQKVDALGGGYRNSWFNIRMSKDDKSPFKYEIDFNDLVKSSNKIKNIIREEAQKLNDDYSKIFVGGFSQGAFLSYDIGLSFERVLGGIVCFCGLPLKQTNKLSQNGSNLNILAILGGEDPLFPLQYAKNQIKSVIVGNKNLIIKEFIKRGHEVSNDELDVMKSFILNKIK
jgi:predicted esterase